MQAMARTRSEGRDFLALLALSSFLLACGIYLTRSYLMDDALITLRYSFNLARHGRAIWNRADAANPSLGYTTVLWMLVNAIPALFTGNKDWLVLCCKMIEVVPLTVIVVLLVRQISRMPVPFSFRAAVVVAVFSQALYGLHVNSGMETLLFSCLVLLTVYSYAAGTGSAPAYTFGTLAFLTRPEGAIMVALVLLWDLRQGRTRQAAVGALCFATAALALALVLHSAYGAVLPDAFYVKQKCLSLGSLAHTGKFLVYIALPYLPLAGYSVFRLKNTASRYCGEAAVVYLAYYLTVAPVMNVFSRYQWPVLVLLTYASFPACQELAQARVKRRRLVVGVLLAFALLNLNDWLGAAWLAAGGGRVEENLISLGKAMGKHRDGARWLAYKDAGAVCYYSDWNAYDTDGLNTRQIAVGAITPEQVYRRRSTDLVLQNCNETDPESIQRCRELGANLVRLGYRYAGSVSILTDGAERPWVIVFYARDLARAAAWLRDVHVAPETPQSAPCRAYQRAWRIVMRRELPGPAPMPRAATR